MLLLLPLLVQVNRYLEAGDKLKAIELFRKANRASDAAQLLALMAEDLSRKHANPLRAKKLMVGEQAATDHHQAHAWMAAAARL